MAQLGLWTALRLVLYGTFREDAVNPLRLIALLAIGLIFDVLAALTAVVPLVFLLSVFRLRWLSRPWVLRLFLTAVFFLFCFDLFVQYFFFEEYGARYNHLALDYLMYPDEVFGNIFASYNVPLFLGIALLLGMAIAWPMSIGVHPSTAVRTWRNRLAGAGASALLLVILWVVWTLAPFSLGVNRVPAELALNGWAQLIRAYMTSHLDYEAYYAMVSPDDARARVARLVDQPVPADGLTRHFVPRGRVAGEPLDVVVVMEESLGSSFSARFGGETDQPVTPELDRWSHEGLALTNLIANGNRTVRGMEGILCSFLPLPGDSVVKRDRSENVASIARLLSARGYQTTFFTGGYGLFDNVKTFMTTNGYQEFVEQPDYPSDAFRTVWGVADEFVFDEMINRQKQANQQGRRWFGTVITGSNHKPFDVPPGRVSWPPDASRRRGAVLYADWALGYYLTRAKQEGLLEHTVILIVGDHGARVYGAEEIPVTSYRVPAMFLSPDPAFRGVTIERLASQVDLAPTLLSLAGVEYDAPFFGRDLLGLPAEGGRAFVNHNRSIGMLTDTALVVLSLHRGLGYYSRSDRNSDTFRPLSDVSDALRETAFDTQSAFQTAYQLYRDRRYILPDQPAVPAATR